VDCYRRMVRVLITGGAGFIGSHITEVMAGAGHDVVVLDVMDPKVHSSETTLDGFSNSGIKVIRGDVGDPAAVTAALRGVDLVCHQAAMVGLSTDIADLPAYVSCNDLGTAVLLAAMAQEGISKLVLASSMVVYGEGKYVCALDGPTAPGPRITTDLDAGRFEPPCPACGAALEPGLVAEDAPADPRNVYAATKLAQENLASAWARAVNGSVTALRYHNVYGPRMPRDTPYAGVASFFRSSLAAGESPQVYEDGGQRRDFIHVSDVAAANLAVAEGAAAGFRAFNVGSGDPHTVGEMAHVLARAFGGPAPVVTGAYRLGDVRHITASSQRLRQELGWEPLVTFTAGMTSFATARLRDSVKPAEG
jgi:dTDP-L-rhamnose 4-epimerase